MKVYNKVIRDHIPEVMLAAGKTFTVRTLEQGDFIAGLKTKLTEELEEVMVATDKESMLEELADLVEVIYAIVEHSEVSIEEFERVRVTKREEKGGFEKGLWLESVKD